MLQLHVSILCWRALKWMQINTCNIYHSKEWRRRCVENFVRSWRDEEEEGGLCSNSCHNWILSDRVQQTALGMGRSAIVGGRRSRSWVWLCAVVGGYLFVYAIQYRQCCRENGDSCEEIIDLIKESSTSLWFIRHKQRVRWCTLCSR